MSFLCVISQCNGVNQYGGRFVLPYNNSPLSMSLPHSCGKGAATALAISCWTGALMGWLWIGIDQLGTGSIPESLVGHTWLLFLWFPTLRQALEYTHKLQDVLPYASFIPCQNFIESGGAIFFIGPFQKVAVTSMVKLKRRAKVIISYLVRGLAQTVIYDLKIKSIFLCSIQFLEEWVLLGCGESLVFFFLESLVLSQLMNRGVNVHQGLVSFCPLSSKLMFVLSRFSRVQLFVTPWTVAH